MYYEENGDAEMVPWSRNTFLSTCQYVPEYVPVRSRSDQNFSKTCWRIFERWNIEMAPRPPSMFLSTCQYIPEYVPVRSRSHKTFQRTSGADLLSAPRLTVWTVEPHYSIFPLWCLLSTFCLNSSLTCHAVFSAVLSGIPFKLTSKCKQWNLN